MCVFQNCADCKLTRKTVKAIIITAWTAPI